VAKLKNISCFIACVFGKDDVDEIYKNAILPTLKSVEIKAYRVDQIEHNDDIDNKIIELLLKCDICIADLTYSRPSVYYEAGYFTGLKKSVIYIARRDHFSPKTEDIYGNFKIHFDLQMKNIIPWSSTSRTDTFNKKLLSRLRLVSKPPIQRIEKEYKQKKAELDFSKLSPKEKELEVESQLLKFLNKESWIRNKVKETSYYNKVYTKVTNKFKNYIIPFITSSATKEYLKYKRIGFYSLKRLENPETQFNLNILFISIRSVPINRLEDMYPEAKPIVNGKVLEVTEPGILNARYLFISNVKSIEGFNKELRIIYKEII
jgi:nucleoside 2-deoxyribosyltransferase